MKKTLNRKWPALMLAIILLTTYAVPWEANGSVQANVCDGVTPGATADCPIMIYDAPGLDAMRTNLTGHYALGADIDLSAYGGPSGWQPIGSLGGDDFAFRGTFNGNGHTIGGLYIESSAGAVGLFGALNNATIRNVGLNDVAITATGEVSYVGGLVGFMDATTLENVYVTGTISGVDHVGGLVGYGIGIPVAPSWIRDSYVSTEVIGSGPHVGGLVGNTEGPAFYVSNTYYNEQLDRFHPPGTGLTEAEMKSAGSFNWDFSDGPWRILEDMTYPMHRTTYEQLLLGDLTVNDGAVDLGSAFVPHAFEYSSRVVTDVDRVTVSVYANSSLSSVTIDGDLVDSKTVALIPGNNIISIAVSTDVAVPGAPTNPFEAVYTLQVIRENGTTYPHRITTASQLEEIGTIPYALDHRYELRNDLDLQGRNWVPIGNAIQPFTGTFEGNNHVIRNLTVSGSQDDAGLFGASAGMIRNVGLEDAHVSGASRVGGLTGSNDGTISNVYVKGDVHGDEQVGGLVGFNGVAATVEYAYAAGLVSGVDPVGGLIGENASGTVTDAYWDIDVGGLAVSDGGEGKATADMQLADTYIGWDFADTWAMMNESAYPMFQRHFEAVKLQALDATTTDAVWTWSPADFEATQGAYDLTADRYIESVNIMAVPVNPDSTVTLGSLELTTAMVSLVAGDNDIRITTQAVNGKPEGVYRLTLGVPAPALIDLDLPSAGLYGLGDALSFNVRYEGAVEVTGTPTLPIVIGEGTDATTVDAVYTGQPNGEDNTITFTYVVTEELAQAGGLEVGTQIDLTNDDAIHAASTSVSVSTSLPTATTTGIVVDALRPEIVLSQQPEGTVPTNQPVSVTATFDGTGSGIAVTKWAEGLRATEFFATAGKELTENSFLANAKGPYSVYAEDEAGNRSVATIEIGNIATDPPRIALTSSPTQTHSAVTIRAEAEGIGNHNSLVSLNWLPGNRSVADFAGGTHGDDILSSQAFTVSANGAYTVYARDAAGNEAVAEITLSNIGSDGDPDDSDDSSSPGWWGWYGDTGGAQPSPPLSGTTVQRDASGGITIVVDPADLVESILADDRIVEQAVLNEDLMEQVAVLLEEARRPFVTVKIDDSRQGVQVELPWQSLEKLMGIEPQTVFKISLNASSYTLPLNVLDGSQPARHVTLSIVQISDTMRNQLAQAANNDGLQPISSGIAYGVSVSFGENTEEIHDFGSTYIVRTLVPDENPDSGIMTAVLYDPATGKFTFLPSLTEVQHDNRPEVVVKAPFNGIYAIMRTDPRSFADLDGHWAQADVELMASKRIVSGRSDTEFVPNRSITRAEFTALLARALGLKMKPVAQRSVFQDILPEKWYAPAVEASLQAGLVSGISGHAFAPDDEITREQMTVMFTNALTYLGYAEINADHVPVVLRPFEDHANISPWAKSAVANNLSAGILVGMTENTIEPAEWATRAQSIVMLRRFMQHVSFID